jgi:hypothetical protein
MRRHSKAYMREQRRDMIRILTRSSEYWQRESERWNRMVDELCAILAGHEHVQSARDVLESFRGWANEADTNLKRDLRELRKWRAKRV